MPPDSTYLVENRRRNPPKGQHMRRGVDLCLVKYNTRRRSDRERIGTRQRHKWFSRLLHFNRINKLTILE